MVESYLYVINPSKRTANLREYQEFVQLLRDSGWEDLGSAKYGGTLETSKLTQCYDYLIILAGDAESSAGNDRINFGKYHLFAKEPDSGLTFDPHFTDDIFSSITYKRRIGKW